MSNYRAIGSSLRERRQQLGLRRVKLAQRLGLSTETIERIEMGETAHLSAGCLAMAMELGVDAEWLLVDAKETKN